MPAARQRASKHDATVVARNRWGPTALAFAAWFLCLIFLVATIVVLLGWRPDGGFEQVRRGRELVPSPTSAESVGVNGGGIKVAPTGGRAVVLNLAMASFDASSAGYVIVTTGPLPAGTQLALLWVQRREPDKVHEQLIKLEGDHAIPTRLDDNLNWDGEIASVDLGVKNPSATSVVIDEIRLVPSDVRITFCDMLREWTHFRGWDGRSINVVFGGSADQRVYMPALAVLAAVLAGCASVLFVSERSRKPALALIVIPFVLSWVLLDVRWQLQLVRQARETHAQFAGKTLAERHAALEYPPFFTLLQAAREHLPIRPARVFITSDYEYFQLRAGYYLYPQNVLAFDWADPTVLHDGDYVLMFAKSGVSFDDVASTLTWSDGRKVLVRPIVVGHRQGLYQVR